MPSLTISYEGKTLVIAVTRDWTGTLLPHLHFVNGHLTRRSEIDWTDARCAACGAPAELTVTKTVGVKAT